MQQSWVQDKFYPIDHPYVVTPHFVHVTYHRLAIRSSLNSQLILSSLATHFSASMQNVNFVIVMPLRSNLHHLLA